MKLDIVALLYALPRSPSTRREWIEIAQSIHQNGTKSVSLHTEGVD